MMDPAVVEALEQILELAQNAMVGERKSAEGGQAPEQVDALPPEEPAVSVEIEAGAPPEEEEEMLPSEEKPVFGKYTMAGGSRSLPPSERKVPVRRR